MPHYAFMSYMSQPLCMLSLFILNVGTTSLVFRHCILYSGQIGAKYRSGEGTSVFGQFGPRSLRTFKKD